MYHLLVGLLDPFLFFFILTAIGIGWIWRSRGGPRRAPWMGLTVAFVGLAITCMPPVAFFGLGTLEWAYPPQYDLPEQTGAIVVMGGAVRQPNALRRRPELEEETTARCMRAAELYREGGPCLVLASGGIIDPDTPGPAVGQAMAEFLLRMGVAEDDLLVEDGSTTTYENAVNSGQILRRHGVNRIVLVTSATHLLRSELCFRKQGFDVTARGCFYRATQFEWTPSSFLPNPSAARSTKDVFHEWLGLAWYWLNGRI